MSNEATARSVNDAIAAGRVTRDGRVGFVCECGRLGCNAILELTLAEYAAVRSDPRQFATVPGHEAGFDKLVRRVAHYVIAANREPATRGEERAQRRWPAHVPGVPVISFRLPAAAESVPRARGLLTAFIAEHTTDHEFSSRVALAFTEGFSNAVCHAYRGGSPGDVHVAADLEHDALEVVIADDGSGFRESTGGGGLGAGMGIMAQSADAFAIRERNPGGTEVWLRFDLPAAAVSASSLVITLEDHPGAAILTITGEIDLATSTQLKRAFDDLLGRERPPAEIRVDLASVEFMDSTGIAILLTAHGSAEAANCRLLITSIAPALRQLFESAGVAQTLMGPQPPPG